MKSHERSGYGSTEDISIAGKFGRSYQATNQSIAGASLGLYASVAKCSGGVSAESQTIGLRECRGHSRGRGFCALMIVCASNPRSNSGGDRHPRRRTSNKVHCCPPSKTDTAHAHLTLQRIKARLFMALCCDSFRSTRSR